LVKGEWQTTKAQKEIIDPLTGQVMLTQPDTTAEEIQPFIEDL
jgi:hypothetical protein